MKFALIIPTKDRPAELRRLLRSVEVQAARPAQIVIVDGSDEPVAALAKEFASLSLDYVAVRPPGLVKQRQAGIQMLRQDIPVFGFLDDDIVVEPGAFEALERFWEAHFAEYSGFGMNIVNAPATRHHGPLVRLFMIHDERPGAVLRSARCNPYCPADQNLETEWLCGGATFWKTELFKEVNFDSWFKGWAIADDLDFCSRINRKHKMVVVADARVQHLETDTRRGRDFTRGYIATINTLKIARSHPQYSLGCAAWSWLGQGTARLAHGAATFNGREMMTGAGHLAAILAGVTGNLRSLDTQVKT